MSALPNPAAAPRPRSLFPDYLTAGRAQTADRLRTTSARGDRTTALLTRIEHLDAVTSPDAPPTHGAGRDLETLATRYVETARLARTLRALADLHDACDVPAPLFGVTTARHVQTLLAPDPVAEECDRPLGRSLLWTRASGMRRAAAVRQMAALLARLGAFHAFPLPAVVARNLPTRFDPTPPDVPPAPVSFEAWTVVVDAAAERLGLSSAVAHFTTVPWREAFDGGLSPDRAAAVLVAYVVGCDVHGVRPFAWSPPPFEPRLERSAPEPPDADETQDEMPVETQPPPEAPERGEDTSHAPPCPRTADRLDAQADRLAADIHHKRHLHADQMLTPRRARIRAAGQREADALEPVRDALRALAAAVRSGALPAALAGVVTRAATEHLVTATAGDVPAYPESDSAHARTVRDRLRRAGIRDADDFDAAVQALAALARPLDERPAEDREATHIRTMTEAVRLSGIPDFFFSPPAVTEALLDASELPHDPGSSFRVLDPSAGDGALLDAARARLPRASLVAVEIHDRLRDILVAKGYALAGADALDFADGVGFDRILANPPFGRGGALAMLHVRQAYTLLKPGGRLVAVVPESCFFRADRAHRDFRAWSDALGGFDRSLPYEAFASAGTSVSARLLILDSLP